MASRNDISWISSEKSRRAKSAVAVALSLIIVLGGLGFGSWKGYSLYMDWRQQDDYIGNGDDPVQILVQPNTGWAVVANSLVSADVIKDPGLFQAAALKINDGPQPGMWNLKTHLPAQTAAEMMNDKSNQVSQKAVVPEGTRLADILPILSKSFQISQDDLNQAVQAAQADPSSIGLNALATQNGVTNLEGFLFPDTYVLYPPFETTPTAVLTKMADEFNDVATQINLEGATATLAAQGVNGITPQQVVIVASIIEAEVSNISQYGPQVARVIYNRIAQGMDLQLDSTVNYGLNRSGHTYLDSAALSTDTPYNTYIHNGFPPTPIDSPGKAALQAALSPAQGDWMYWTTVNLQTGETRFETTDADHQADVDLLNQYCKDNPQSCPS